MGEDETPGRASEYLDLGRPEDVVASWNHTGYDITVGTRWVYAFVHSTRARVKVGMVGRGSRLAVRHREVAARHPDPLLWYAADVAIPAVDAQTVEGIEASMQTWLALRAGLPFSGYVDWLAVPEGHPARAFGAGAWQHLLQQARDVILSWRDHDPGGGGDPAGPRIVVRDGPAGRRPGLVGGPDVAEVAGAVVGGDVPIEDRARRAAEQLGISLQMAEAALGYDARFPEEVDGLLAAQRAAAREAEATWRSEQRDEA